MVPDRDRVSVGAWPILLFALAGFLGCSSSPVESSGDPAVARGSEWVESSHGKVAPDTAKAFADTLRAVTIELSAVDWTQMVDAVATACGAVGTATTTCTGGKLDSLPVFSRWFSAEIVADGQRWSHVGFRLNGNSDLVKAWQSGRARFPFKLTMDKLEDSFPSIKNQRFYGFKKLEMENLQSDPSLVRHRVGSSVMRAFGVPAPFDQLVRLTLAHGSGSEDLGIYSLREVLDKPILDRWFGDHSGNLYVPSSSFKTFDPSDFEEDGVTDDSDVRALVSALNASSRTSSPATWRQGLSATFDASAFLRWLAVTTALRTGGVYGSKAEGYGLYDQAGRMRWISKGMDGAFGSHSPGVWHPEAGENWPMVSFLLADPSWCAEYASDLKSLAASGGLVASATLQARINSKAAVVRSVAGVDAATATMLDFAAIRAGEIDTSIRNHPCP